MENTSRKKRHHKGLIGPVILLILGTVFLLEKNGLVQRELLSQWWPLLFIGIGGALLVRRINRNRD